MTSQQLDRGLALSVKIEKIKKKLKSMSGLRLNMETSEGYVTFESLPLHVEKKCLALVREHYEEELKELQKRFKEL